MKAIAVSLFACLNFALVAQTITPNEGSVLLSQPKKIGINLGGPGYFGAGELYKNLLWRNPGFEPDLYRDKFVAYQSGTTTTFTAPSQYDPVVANFWTGASFWLYRGSPKALVCSGTIASNTTATSTTGPTYTFSAPCSTDVAEGDVIVLRLAVSCTPEADWEGQHGGWWTSISGGGRILSDCTTPYDGVQSMQLNASASGSTAEAIAHIDSANWVIGLLFNNQYTISGYYKTIGSPTFTVAAQRNVSGQTGNPLSCPAQTFPASSSWTSFTMTCTGSETAALPQGDVTVTFAAQGGSVELDDVSFQRTSGLNAANTSVFRDEVLATLQAHCAGASLTGVPCELRDWAGQNADEIANTVKPLFQRMVQVNSFGYDYAGGQGYPSEAVGFEEFLQLCALLGAEPYYVLPETARPDEAGNWIDYINGSSSTTYGALRAAHGQSSSWLTVFPNIHLSMGNENWNESESGQGLGYRSDAPDLYYDYSSDAAGVWNAMRADASWPSGGDGIDLILGFQDGNTGEGVSQAMTRASANSGELAPYTQDYVGNTSPLSALWTPLMYEVVSNVSNSNATCYQQGTAIQGYGKLNVYEFDNGTLSGSSSLTQAVVDSFTDAAGYGTATALQALEHLEFGIVDQNFFSLSQYYDQISNGDYVHNWGAVIDMGGATNAIRPQELGMRVANAAIIGPMYSCPVSNPTTYNLGANQNGISSSGTPSANNISQEYAFCFMSGTQRSMIVINTDIAASHTILFAGSQAPVGTVTVTRYAPSNISATNEAAGTAFTDGAPQNVSINAPVTLSSPTSDTGAPYSITRYDWISGSGSPPSSSTTTLAASPTSATAGSSILLTATVANSGATGSVTFTDSGTVVGTSTLNSGTASFTVNNVSAGTHNYVAQYGGNSTYAASTSNTVVVSVTAGSNGPYLHTTFNEEGAGSALNGTAPAIGPSGAVWTDSNGDWSFLSGGGITSASPDLGHPTTINGGSANYVATVSAAAYGAKVLFRYVDLNDYIFVETFQSEVDLYSRVSGSNTTLATIYPSSGACTISLTLNGASASLSCGGQTATGTIPSSLLSSATVGFMPLSTGFVYETLDLSPVGSGEPASTTTTLSSSNTSPAPGSSITLTASVAPSAATGNVTFFDGSTSLGSGTLSGGVATFSVSSVSAGTHNYTATYQGSTSYASSTSSVVTISTLASTTTTLSASNTNPPSGGNITLSAVVSPSAATGTVIFYDGTSQLGSSTLSSGSASYPVTNISSGNHSYTASYQGSASYASSTSSAVAVSTLISTSTTLSASTTTPTNGSSDTLTAVISPSAATGTVTFSDGSTVLGSSAISGGSATYIVSSITQGSHSYTASYGGNAQYAASTSNTVSVTASGAYINTSFNEYAAGHALNGTVPATAPPGSSWSDPNGDWSYISAGGIKSASADLGNPTTINASQANYVATFTLSSYGAEVLFRYVDINDYIFVETFASEIDLYSNVAGTQTKLATITPSNTAAQLTVTLNGSAATIQCGTKSATGTLPSSLLSSTVVGFLPLSSGFKIKTLNVSP